MRIRHGLEMGVMGLEGDLDLWAPWEAHLLGCISECHRPLSLFIWPARLWSTKIPARRFVAELGGTSWIKRVSPLFS
jgi:hypothetical protein